MRERKLVKESRLVCEGANKREGLFRLISSSPRTKVLISDLADSMPKSEISQMHLTSKT